MLTGQNESYPLPKALVLSFKRAVESFGFLYLMQGHSSEHQLNGTYLFISQASQKIHESWI